MIISDRPPLSSLIRIFLLVVVVGWFVIGQGVGIAVGMAIYGDSFLTALSDIPNHPDLKYAILFSQGIGALIGLILIPWYYLRESEHLSLNGFFKKESQWVLLLITIFIGVISLGQALSFIVEWNANIHFPDWMSWFDVWARKMEGTAAEITSSLTSNLTPLSFVLTFIVVGIIPAIGEELVFRGLIQSEFQRSFKNPHLAIWITAILFSAIHLEFFGFVPRVLLGAFLGYLFYWSGNLMIPILGHFFNNALIVVAIYLKQLEIITIDLENAKSAPLPIVAIGTILTILILYYLRNYFNSRSTPASDPV